MQGLFTPQYGKKIKTIIFIILISSSFLSTQGFLKVSGKTIVNGNGTEVLLRGMGLGGWLLPEGYMLKTSGFADAFWQMKQHIKDVVGQQNADSFWTAYRKNFVQRKDIEALAQMGFNSVRMVLHWEFFMDGNGWKTEGFAFIDSVLQWCKENNLYVILDLHAAPGGQSANNISDYNPSFLSLWESEANRLATVRLWKKIAERYKDEPWIGGYDILNEPAWDLGSGNVPLRNLYVMITDSIRSVDTNHIIFVEGNWYATDFSGLTPPWDANMVYSFHKYWNATDAASIGNFLSLRNSTNRPLWLGESGENSNTWFTEVITMLEANNIGWAWWTYKKFDAINGPFSVPITPEYNNLLRYWRGEIGIPTVATAMKGLMDMAEGLRLENCIYNAGVIDAMFRQVYDATTKPFKEHIIPGKIFAVDYDFGRYNVAYKDTDYKNTSGSAGGASWNSGGQYRNDGVDIEKCTDTETNGYNVGWTATGEYLTYTANIAQSGKYKISVRVASNQSGGIIGVNVDNGAQQLLNVPITGGWQTWQTYDVGTFNIVAGTHTLRLSFYFGGFNVNYLETTYTGPLSVDAVNIPPADFSLKQNFPNPFNPLTEIKFELPQSSRVSLKVFDLLGHEIVTLVNETKPAGYHSVQFDASRIPSGIYFYTIHADNYSQTRKMILLK